MVKEKEGQGIMKNNAELIKEMEDIAFYEMQHIPFYYDRKKPAYEKYFWDAELEYFLKKGKKLYTKENDVVLYAVICAMESFVKDVNDKRPRPWVLFGENSGSTVKHLKTLYVRLVKEYKSILKERHVQCEKRKRCLKT